MRQLKEIERFRDSTQTESALSGNCEKKKPKVDGNKIKTGPSILPFALAWFPGKLTREHDPEKACPGLDPGWEPVFG
jgi:hypothetical protein